MSNGATAGGAAAAAAAAAAIQAVKASGAIVRLEPDDFRAILERAVDPIVVRATSWSFGTVYRYLTNYRGFFFFASSRFPISLPPRAETIDARKIWAPS